MWIDGQESTGHTYLTGGNNRKTGRVPREILFVYPYAKHCGQMKYIFKVFNSILLSSMWHQSPNLQENSNAVHELVADNLISKILWSTKSRGNSEH